MKRLNLDRIGSNCLRKTDGCWVTYSSIREIKTEDFEGGRLNGGADGFGWWSGRLVEEKTGFSDSLFIHVLEKSFVYKD